MTIDIVTIFPEFFSGPFEHGIIRRARESGLVEIGVHDLRKFTDDRHHVVDDRPFGGEEGMVLKPEPLFRAVEELRGDARDMTGATPRETTGATSGAMGGATSRVILLSAQGRLFRQRRAAELAQLEQVILLCGRYEGVDERVAGHLADEEISIGDYVLSGGELPAAVIVDAIVRLLPGAVGNAASVVRESFAAEGSGSLGAGILDCPHYTRPAEFRDLGVPDVLLSGDHRRVEQWRRRKALEKTWKNRPDLLNNVILDEQQQEWLRELEKAEKQ